MKKFNNVHLLFIFFLYFSGTTHSLFSPSSKSKTTAHPSATLTSNEDVKTYFFKQTLDHFNHLPKSYTKFKQRYYVNFKYWGGANSSAPILAYLGAESEMEMPDEDFGTDNAASFKALLVYIEHRYYGKSVPFGSKEKAYKNANTLGYLNSEQALADYAAVLIYLKNSLHAQESPVIVMGASYGGMLAAWFRLKYPHVAVGALASSAPLLYFDNITPQNAYYDVVTRDFKEASETCYKFIRNSWSEIDKVASQRNGLSSLSQRFNTCYPLEQSDELKEFLRIIYIYSAQFDYPLVRNICKAIDGASFGSDVLSRIYGGVVAYHESNKCTVNAYKYTVAADTFNVYEWQRCTEIVMPIGITGNSTMFQPMPFSLKNYAKKCKKDFGVSPRPHWITAYYGGHNMKLVLRRFGSNIIFSNGLRDPYSSGGVLKNLSDSLVALSTVKGTHGMDLMAASESDQDWLTEQRKKEVEIMHGWIKQYYADIDALE
ncbi:uncharacterized protein LOC127086147 [Lathyrus oleraceus]|uniref:Lysosomal Pro-X carboxypeptidase n=1 Tax=Pisum sativum TaxID=3888 RepID=A0A9D4X3K4_PEA|nr:uncharacterized protein LOC127086142 [Pisum sativum]XP_050882820.1 uncharacterized protein LOC127086147 [Pisum sativum]KAI5411556.1 hypothetical protein KIW84_056567 [Pisum sativum]